MALLIASITLGSRYRGTDAGRGLDPEIDWQSLSLIPVNLLMNPGLISFLLDCGMRLELGS